MWGKLKMRYCAPFRSNLYLPLYLTAVISGLVYLPDSHGLLPLLWMIGLGALIAYAETAICIFIPKRLTYLVFGVILTASEVLMVVDYFCLIEFGHPIVRETIDIILETNPRETSEFLSTYLSFGRVCLIVLLLVIYNGGLFLITFKIAQKRIIKYAALVSCFLGICAISYCLISFLIYRDGRLIPQYSAPVRIAYNYYCAMKSMDETEQLVDLYSGIEAKISGDTILNIIFVIGESHNVHHAQLYGYDKPTQPRLSERMKSGDLYVFHDIVSKGAHTSFCMPNIYSVDDSRPFSECPIFPMVFRKAGYRVNYEVSQYMLDEGISFLSSRDLSRVAFDYRNEDFVPDSILIARTNPSLIPTLHIIHVQGQHYVYSTRYPREWAYFTFKDYPGRSQAQGEILAHYDNAVLYGDYLVDKLIRKFENEDCCLVFMSDHGEEVLDIDDYYGHGRLDVNREMSYQLHIPVWVWISNNFKLKHPELTARIASSVDNRAHQRHISQTLMDIGGISSKCVSCEKSIINPKYDTSQKRIVGHTINYDDYKHIH